MLLPFQRRLADVRRIRSQHTKQDLEITLCSAVVQPDVNITYFLFEFYNSI